MLVPDIQAFVLDDVNEGKFAVHAVTAEQVLQVLENRHVILRNRGERRATHIVIGMDDEGSCIAVPVEPTYDPGLWRPITAWYCKRSEWVRLG